MGECFFATKIPFFKIQKDVLNVRHKTGQVNENFMYDHSES